MFNFTPESLEFMRSFNTFVAFIICVAIVGLCYGNLIYQIGWAIVTFVKFVIRKIKEKKKGTEPDENTHTEH